MNGKMKQFKRLLFLLSLSLVVLIVVSGCKKAEPEDSSGTVPKVETVTAGAGEQTMCPVMSAPINKELFVEYKGKKVYFCCEGCKEKFLEEPEKYLAKLPQFK
jgi:YHS domain-containing protein